MNKWPISPLHALSQKWEERDVTKKKKKKYRNDKNTRLQQ